MILLTLLTFITFWCLFVYIFIIHDSVSVVVPFDISCALIIPLCLLISFVHFCSFLFNYVVTCQRYSRFSL